MTYLSEACWQDRKGGPACWHLLLNWLLSALSLLIVCHIVPGFQMASFGTALIAALVIGLFNATIAVPAQDRDVSADGRHARGCSCSW